MDSVIVQVIGYNVLRKNFERCFFPFFSDINECDTLAHNCNVNAVCKDSIGSFTCTCNPGFIGSGVVCSKIDNSY